MVALKVDREILITLVLKHKNAFLLLLDYVMEKGGSAAIPQKLYIDQYNRVIVASGDEQAIRLLTLDNLYRNGVFAHLDNHTETLVIHQFLIEMLRFIDSSRRRELSGADFEQIRKQFEAASLRMGTEVHVVAGDPLYEEELVTLFELIDTTLSRVQQNTEALAAHADDLGRRYELLDVNGYSTVDTIRLLEEASRLYERFIKPCLEFLNPDLQLKDKRLNFTQSIERLATFHEDLGYTETGLRIRYKSTAIHSYYKDIYEVERRVQRYCNSLADERLKYTAIERAYNQLLDEVKLLRHGKLKNTKLTADLDIFSKIGYLDGLAFHSKLLSPRINWLDGNNKQSLDEWLTAKISSYTEKLPKPVVKMPLSAAATVANSRYSKIVELCVLRDWPVMCGDLIKDAHNWLSDSLEDYSLLDLLVAYQYVYSNIENISVSVESCCVEDDRYYLDYLVVKSG